MLWHFVSCALPLCPAGCRPPLCAQARLCYPATAMTLPSFHHPLPSSAQMPNLHFIPCVPVTTKSFDNDVYVATSEPHGELAVEFSCGC